MTGIEITDDAVGPPVSIEKLRDVARLVDLGRIENGNEKSGEGCGPILSLLIKHRNKRVGTLETEWTGHWRRFRKDTALVNFVLFVHSTVKVVKRSIKWGSWPWKRLPDYRRIRGENSKRPVRTGIVVTGRVRIINIQPNGIHSAKIENGSITQFPAIHFHSILIKVPHKS